MRVLIFLLSLFAALACVNEVRSQLIQKKVKFRHLKENPQLSNLNIQAICQDSKGYLWVGTEDGLNRFDGYDVKIYRNIENDSSSLVKNQIEVIFEDSRGVVWISSINFGVQIYDRDSDSFSRIPEFSQQHCKVYSIIEDINNDVWIGGTFNNHAFIAKYDYSSGKWGKHQLFNATEGIRCMLQYSEDIFWLGSRSDGLFKWNSKTNDLEQFIHDPLNENSLPGNYIKDIAMDLMGNLWIGDREKGLSKFDVKKNTFRNFTSEPGETQIKLPSNAIERICPDGQYLWIASGNGGLSKIDTRNESITNFLYNKYDHNSIINNSIRSLHKDQQGRLWIGSFAKGLCVFDSLEDKILVPDIPLENDLVNSIMKDSKERLWIGTENGLILLDKYGMQRFLHDSKNTLSLSSNAVLDVFEDSKQRIWIGLYNGGINCYDEKSHTFIRFPTDPIIKGSLSSPHVFSIMESSKTGELLVATHRGLNLLKDEEKGVFEHEFNYLSEIDKSLHALHEDSEQNLWVGSLAGLSKYSLKDKSIKRIDILKDSTKGHDHVTCIYEDQNGVIWIGSIGGLHEMINPSKFITYTTKDGLPVNVIQDIVADSKGNLWLATTKGLTFFNTTTKTFKTYDESDGLMANHLRSNTFFKSVNDQIYVGGVGINTFHPDSIISNPHKPPVYITDLKVFNQSIRPKAKDGILRDVITETKEIFLNHTHNFFSLHYVGINFTASYKNQYAYQLEGFDNDWIYIGTQRFASFTNLGPGTYTFRVKASNNDGLWNEVGASLIVHILPPWWYTWWAKMLWITIVISLITLIYSIRVRSLNSQRKKLQIQVTERTTELGKSNQELEQSNLQLRQLDEYKESMTAMIVHDFKNSLNTVISFSEGSPTERRLKSIRQAGQFMLNMVLNILDVQKFEAAEVKLSLANYHMAKVLNDAIDQMSYMLEEKSIKLTYVDNDLYCRIDYELITRTIINILSNAIKYVDINGAIEIRTGKQGDLLVVTIKDNGLGIPADKVHMVFDKYAQINAKKSGSVRSTGLGLAFCKMVVEAHGGTIGVESIEGEGSEFYFTVPRIEDIEELAVPFEKVDRKIELALTFSEMELAQLQPILEALKQWEVYDYSEIKTVIDNMQHLDGNIATWKERLQKAIHNGNEKAYNELINL
ncbi:MAG: ATP-binding protein [Reichenbachiella sp.]